MSKKNAQLELKVHGELYILEKVPYEEFESCGERVLSPEIGRWVFTQITGKHYLKKCIEMPVIPPYPLPKIAWSYLRPSGGAIGECGGVDLGVAQRVSDGLWYLRKEGVRMRKVVRTYGKGKDLLVIENIPVVSCPHCGESYLTAETLHEIERLKLHRKSLAVKRPVETLSFA